MTTARGAGEAWVRGMVKIKVERIREKEKSVLYKIRGEAAAARNSGEEKRADGTANGYAHGERLPSITGAYDPAMGDAAVIEAQLCKEENSITLRHNEDTLSKVWYVQYPYIPSYIYPSFSTSKYLTNKQ
jgi:hypothetical protein